MPSYFVRTLVLYKVRRSERKDYSGQSSRDVVNFGGEAIGVVVVYEVEVSSDDNSSASSRETRADEVEGRRGCGVWLSTTTSGVSCKGTAFLRGATTERV